MVSEDAISPDPHDMVGAKYAPRVTLADIDNAIEGVYFTNGAAAFGPVGNFWTLTLCMVHMKNGFMVIGKSAPVSSKNYDKDVGKRCAFEDAIKQIWPLMGFSLCDRLYEPYEAPTGLTSDAVMVYGGITEEKSATVSG